MSRRKDDIERYLRGEMNATEMHALEKEALKDPFLSEALEGINQADSQDFLFDLKELHNTVHQRTKTNARKPKFISMWNWSLGIAAGLILMAVSSVYIIMHLPKPENRMSALDKSSTTEEKQVTADSLKKNAENDQPPSLNTEPKQSENSNNKPSISPSKSKVSPAHPVTGPVASTEESEDQTTVVEPSTPLVTQTGRPGGDDIADVAGEQGSRKNGSTLLPSADSVHLAGTPAKVVYGKVISIEDGAALPGVNVVVKGTSVGTITDHEGNYKIPLSDINQHLVFNFIGMKPVDIAPGNKAEVDVKMSPDYSQLSEVIVTGYSTGTKIEGDYPTWEFAAPEGGKPAFQKYLEEKMTYPEQALQNSVEGTITVQFLVGSDGTLEDFKVIKGLGYGCEDEVIRLIKEGPAWSPSKRNAEPVPDKVKVRLKFDIPNKK